MLKEYKGNIWKISQVIQRKGGRLEKKKVKTPCPSMPSTVVGQQLVHIPCILSTICM